MENSIATVPAEHCTDPAAHLDCWHHDGTQVICPICQPPAPAGIAGGWHDVESVLMDLPVVREAIRRLTR